MYSLNMEQLKFLEEAVFDAVSEHAIENEPLTKEIMEKIFSGLSKSILENSDKETSYKIMQHLMWKGFLKDTQERMEAVNEFLQQAKEAGFEVKIKTYGRPD